MKQQGYKPGAALYLSSAHPHLSVSPSLICHSSTYIFQEIIAGRVALQGRIRSTRLVSGLLSSFVSVLFFSLEGVEMAASTLFVNQTRDMVRMKVGNSQYSSDIASIKGGGEYRMHINVHDTYREFVFGIGSEGKKVIVTSDDCCDYQCITIKEVDGQLDLLKEPRQEMTSSAVEQTTAAKKPRFIWKMRILYSSSMCGMLRPQL